MLKPLTSDMVLPHFESPPHYLQNKCHKKLKAMLCPPRSVEVGPEIYRKLGGGALSFLSLPSGEAEPMLISLKDPITNQMHCTLGSDLVSKEQVHYLPK